MRFLSLLILLACTQVALAEAADCDNASNQSEMNRCAAASFEKADTELNSLYRDIQHRAASDAQSSMLLIASQRAWIAFRDAECSLSAAGSIGGSIHPMIYSGRLERITRARIEDFKRILKCEEADLSCPIPSG